MRNIKRFTKFTRSLRIKTFATVVLTLIFLFFSYLFISTYLIQRGYSDLESKETHENIHHTLEVLRAETASLNSKTGDWANWDDAYDFVISKDQHEDFITTNMMDTSFQQLGINLILFINNSGEITFGKRFDLEENQVVPVSKWWQIHIHPDSQFIQKDPKKDLSGLVLVDNKPMLIAVRPILTSNGEGPVAGTLIFGRYLNHAKINELAERKQHSLAIEIFGNLSPGFQAAGSNLSETNPIWAYPKDSKTMLGYALVNDIFGRPVLVLQETLDRDIYDFGLKSARIITLVFIGFCIILTIMVMLILEKGVLSRLFKLRSEIKMIGKKGSPSTRVKGFGSDELGDLARSINDSLEKIEGQTQELRLKEEVAERLNEDLEKFHLAVENASDHILFADPTGTIVYVNDAIRTSLGYEPAEVIGKKAGASSPWGGEMKPEYYDQMWDTISNKKKPFFGEMIDRRKDGALRTINVSVMPIIKNDEVKFFVTTGHDITEIREADKMKDEFLSVASHELRTPMTVIKGYISLLKDGSFGAITDIQKQQCEKIETNVSGLISLVNDMLDLNKLEGGRMEVNVENIDINPFIHQLLEEFTVLYHEKNISLTYSNSITDSEQQKNQITADFYLLRRILTNLLSNAYKFTPNDGKVEIVAEQYSIDPKYLLISVKDNGEGIPPEKLEKVFEKFSQINTVLQREHGGTGLGLAIVKRMVEALKGKVWVESIPKKGSEFRFLVPFSE